MTERRVLFDNPILGKMEAWTDPQTGCVHFEATLTPDGARKYEAFLDAFEMNYGVRIIRKGFGADSLE